MKLNASFKRLALILLAAPSAAFAALGADVSSLQSDRMSMKATLPVETKAENYSMHEMKTASGVVVHEYAASTGTVFAIAWQGRTTPNLRQLMGDRFDTFSKAAKARHGDHTHFEMRQDDLVVLSRGHMRSFSGIAYIPGTLPAGMKEADIK